MDLTVLFCWIGGIVLIVILGFIMCILHLVWTIAHAAIDAYDTLSLELQFEEEAIQRIRNSPSIHIERFLHSRCVQFFYGRKKGNTDERYDHLVGGTLLRIMAECRYVQITLTMLTVAEVAAFTRRIASLPERHQQRFNDFSAHMSQMHALQRLATSVNQAITDEDVYFDEDLEYEEPTIAVTFIQKIPGGRKPPKKPQSIYTWLRPPQPAPM